MPKIALTPCKSCVIIGGSRLEDVQVSSINISSLLGLDSPKGREKYFDPNRGKDLRRSEVRRTFVVSEMWDLHHEIARLVVLGWKNVDIAKKLRCSPQQVSNVRNSPVVIEHMNVLRKSRDADVIDIAKDIRDLAPIALRNLKSVIESGELDGEKASLVLRVKESNNMLDRAGYSAPKKVLGLHAHRHLTDDEIEDIKERAKVDEHIVEGEFEEV